MSDADYRSVEDAISVRLATSTLRFVVLARWRGALAGPQDRACLQWLEALLLRSLGGARRVAAAGELLAPELGAQHGTVEDELEAFAQLRRLSGAGTPAQHAAWVGRAVAALRGLSAGGWRGLDARERAVVQESVVPLLRALVAGRVRSPARPRRGGCGAAGDAARVAPVVLAR